MQLQSLGIMIEHNEVMSTFSLKETLSRFSLAIRLQIECFLKEETKSDLVKPVSIRWLRDLFNTVPLIFAYRL